MQKQQTSHRKARTRLMIQAGGLLHKSGLMDAFLIEPGEDLQAYENLEKAAKLLGFLTSFLEEKSFDETNLERWKLRGERLLKYDRKDIY